MRMIDGWGWCGTTASEVGLVCTTLGHTRESASMSELQRASSASRSGPRGSDRLRRRRTEHTQWPAAGRTAYHIAGHALEELWEYLTSGRQRLDVALDQRASTTFQHSVWEQMRHIPFGETRSYAWLARSIGRPHATQAVGRAVSSSPNLIFIPCHRVVAARGIGGYSRGTKLKQRLLDHEQSWPRMLAMPGT